MSSTIRFRSGYLDLDKTDVELPSQYGPTSFQSACHRKYAYVPEKLRPKPRDFVAIDPSFSRQMWSDIPPEELMVSSLTDSAIDIMGKIQCKVNGGTRIIDSHKASITDLLVRSDHVSLATPTMDGAQFMFEASSKSKSDRILTGVEEDPQLSRVLPRNVKSGMKVTCLLQSRASVGHARSLGERSARVFEPEDNVPQLNTTMGRKLDSFSQLTMRLSDPLEAHSVVAKELKALSGIDMPEQYTATMKEFAGDTYVRSAAMGDRKYHAVTNHASAAGTLRVRMAPMHSQSYGRTTPAHWQLLRTIVRATGQLNMGMDTTCMAIMHDNPEAYKIGYSVSGNSLPEFIPSTASLSIMAYMQSLPEFATEYLVGFERMLERRLVDSSVFREGGLRDRMMYNIRMAELDTAKDLEMEDLDEVPMVSRLRLMLPDVSVTARSSIMRPSVRVRGKTKKVEKKSVDDLELTMTRHKSLVAGIPRDEFNQSGGPLASSLGALLRYGISIAYMERSADIRTRGAMFVKQWNMCSDGKPLKVTKYSLRDSEVLSLMSRDVITFRVASIMADMVPYSMIGTEEDVRLIVTRRLDTSYDALRSPNGLKDAVTRYLASKGAYHERYVIRRTLGRLIHAGMSDSGLMFAIKTGMSQRREMRSIIMEHIRYKIDVWKANYSAQLELHKAKRAAGEGMDYPQIVIWQQKVSMLKYVEWRETTKGIDVFVRDISYNMSLISSYRHRYDSLLRRYVTPQMKMSVKGLHNRCPHPWGVRMSDEQCDALALGPRVDLLRWFDKLEEKYWVVPPRELVRTVDAMLEHVVQGIRSAIENANHVEMLKEETDPQCFRLDLPPDLDMELSAKYVFSLNDPPSARPEAAKRPPSIESTSSITSSSRANADAAMQFVLSSNRRPIRRVKGTKAPARKEKPRTVMVHKTMTADPTVNLLTVSRLLEGLESALVVPICTWLGELSSLPVTPDTPISVLPSRYVCDPSSLGETRLILMEDYKTQVLRDLARGDRKYVDDM